MVVMFWAEESKVEPGHKWWVPPGSCPAARADEPFSTFTAWMLDSHVDKGGYG